VLLRGWMGGAAGAAILAALLAVFAPTALAAADPGPAGSQGVGSQGDASPGEVRVHDRLPLALVVLTSAKAAAGVAEMAGAVDGALKKHTNLELKLYEPDNPDILNCSGKLSCIVLRVRAEDYDFAKLRDSFPRYAGYRSHLVDSKKRYPSELVLLSLYQGAGGVDRISAQLVDTDRALAAYHDADRRDAQWERRVEEEIEEQAVLVRGEVRQVKGPGEARTYLVGLIEREFRRNFEDNGWWDAFGRIEITGVPAGMAVLLDGAMVGTTQPERTVLVEVSPGERVIGLDHAEYAPFSAPLTVAPRTAAALRPALSARNRSTLANSVVFWSGVAAGAAGVAITGVAIARASSEKVTVYCGTFPGASTASCGGPEFLAFEPAAAGGDPLGRSGDPNPGHLLIAPLGYSLLAAGAVWTLGALLASDTGEVPWIPLLIGATAGAAAYGVSAALDGQNAIKRAGR
jgi:hypothetical protein